MLPIHTGQHVYLKPQDSPNGQSARNSSGAIPHVRSAFYPRGAAGVGTAHRPGGPLQPILPTPDGTEEGGGGVDAEGQPPAGPDDGRTAFTITPGGSGRDVPIDDLQYFLDEVTNKRIREMLKTSTYTVDHKAELELWNKILDKLSCSDEKPSADATAIIVKSEEGAEPSSSSRDRASSCTDRDAGGTPAVPVNDGSGVSAELKKDLPDVPPVRYNESGVTGQHPFTLGRGRYVGSGLSRTTPGRPSASSRYGAVQKENEYPSSSSSGRPGWQARELRYGAQSHGSSSLYPQRWQRPGAWGRPEERRAATKRTFEKRDGGTSDHGRHKLQKLGDGRAGLLSSKSQQGPRLLRNTASPSGKDEEVDDDSADDDSGEGDYDSGLDSDE